MSRSISNARRQPGESPQCLPGGRASVPHPTVSFFCLEQPRHPAAPALRFVAKQRPEEMFANSPAKRGSLAPGDVITAVNGHSLQGASSDEATTRMEGAERARASR